MDLQDAGATTVKYLIRDRDSKYTATSDTVLADSGITVVKPVSAYHASVSDRGL